MKSYDELFDVRGMRYDCVMQLNQEARQQEFTQETEAARLSSDMIAADVPAWGDTCNVVCQREVDGLGMSGAQPLQIMGRWGDGQCCCGLCHGR